MLACLTRAVVVVVDEEDEEEEEEQKRRRRRMDVKGWDGKGNKNLKGRRVAREKEQRLGGKERRKGTAGGRKEMEINWRKEGKKKKKTWRKEGEM